MKYLIREMFAILFETMIFGGQYDDYQWRYSTYEEAEAGHNSLLFS